MDVDAMVQRIRDAGNDWEEAHIHEDKMMLTALETIAANMTSEPEALAQQVLDALAEFAEDQRWYA